MKTEGDIEGLVSVVGNDDIPLHAVFAQSHIESVLKFIVIDLSGLGSRLKLEDHAIEGQLLGALFWNELGAAGKSVLHVGWRARTKLSIKKKIQERKEFNEGEGKENDDY